MDIKVDVQGLKGVEDALAQAGPKLAKRSLRKALTAGGEVLVSAVKPYVPVLTEATPQRRPGDLRDSITTKLKLSAKEESGTLVVGPEYKKADGNQSPGVYGIMVEFGSIHNAAKPYLRPGFEEGKEKALAAFTEVLRANVDSLKS